MSERKQRAPRGSAATAESQSERPRDARGCFLAHDGTAAAKPRARKRRARAKAVRWSARREQAFLTALADTANIAASVRAAGLSDTTVYRRRRDNEDFRSLWAAALREGVAKLEMMLLDRAMNGVEKPVWYGGKQVGTMTDYSDRLALALLAFHRGGGGNGFGRQEPAEMSIGEKRTALKAKLSEMNKRMGGAG